MISERWVIQQRARMNLLYAQNCAHATLVSIQDIFEWRDPVLVRAATNFEGGVVGCGETCGVVSGGILALGGLMARELPMTPHEREETIYRLAGSYVKWFESRFGTSMCRERVGVDFHKGRDLLRYVLPGDKLLRCLTHTGEAVWFLTDAIRGVLRTKRKPGEGSESGTGEAPLEPHCTFTVLKRIYPEQIGFTDSLRGATTGLAGGVGLSGAVCGALLAGIMAIGLRYGYDVRSMTFGAITAAFVRGHWNLLRGVTGVPPKEAFSLSSTLAERFSNRFGSMNCKDIAKRDFFSPQDLRAFLAESTVCEDVFSWCDRETRRLLTV